MKTDCIDSQIESFMTEAGAAGDSVGVLVCRRALGHELTRDEMRSVRAARVASRTGAISRVLAWIDSDEAGKEEL